MNRSFLFVLLFSFSFAAPAQELPVLVKSEIFATILQGKVDKNVVWDKPGAPGHNGTLSFSFFFPRVVVRDSQEINYHLDMGHKLFLSFFSSRELQGLRSYQVSFPIMQGHGADIYEMRLDVNFRDMEESEYMRLERLTRAIPYFAWSNYLSISHHDRDRVIVNLKDMEEMTPDSAREDFCNVLAFAVYYYAFRQQLTKPLEIIYRSPGETKRYSYPVGTDFKKTLALFNTK